MTLTLAGDLSFSDDTTGASRAVDLTVPTSTSILTTDELFTQIVMAYDRDTAIEAPPFTTPLTWSPPVLSNPTVFSPTNTDYSSRYLDAAGADVLVHMPSFVLTNYPGAIGCLRIDNAHHIVIQGGQFDAPTSAGNEFQRMAMVFSGCTGTIHVEGVLVGSDTSYITDAIDVYSSPLATLQVQNCEFFPRAVDEADFTDAHSDGIFVDNSGTGLSLKNLRTDRLRINTDYQGLSVLGKGCTAYFTRTHVIISEKGQDTTTQAIWQADNSDPMTFGPDVWLTPRPGQALGFSVHPDASDANHARRPSVSATNFVTWPGEPTIVGGVQGGTPPVDFVATDRGIGYTPRSTVVQNASTALRMTSITSPSRETVVV
jgi:hypothetical protein